MARPKGPERTAIGVRLLPETVELLQFGLRHSTPTGAATTVLELWPGLITTSLLEIRGKLSTAEASLILDACNGLALIESLLGQHVELEVRDSIRLNGYAKKWRVDGDKLVATLAGLTRAQRIALELWAADAWEHSEDQAYWDAAIARLVPEDAA